MLAVAIDAPRTVEPPMLVFEMLGAILERGAPSVEDGAPSIFLIATLNYISGFF